MGTLKRIAGPAYLTGSAANVYTPPGSEVYTVIKHIRLVNTDTVARTPTLYVGATGGSAGGTEILKDKSIAAKDTLDIYFSPGMKMLSTDFLSGLADSASKVTITVMGEYNAV